MLDAQIYAVTNGTDEMPLPKKEFDLLYKLLSDPSQLNKRQGMSLAIVQRIFELRQDKITVQSTAGSERIFTIMLP